MGAISNRGSTGGVQTLNTDPPDANHNFDVISNITSIDIVTVAGQLTLQPYTLITGSLNNNIGTVEVGQSFPSVNLTWSLSKTETSQSLNHGIGNLVIGLRNYLVVGTITSNISYTLSFTDTKGSNSASTSISFLNRVHWGPLANPSLTSPNILSLANSTLSSSRSRTFTINCNNQYIWIVYPVTYGAATFKVNGFNTTFNQSIVSHTNAYGHTENYYTYRSQFLQNGSGIEVQVI